MYLRSNANIVQYVFEAREIVVQAARRSAVPIRTIMMGSRGLGWRVHEGFLFAIVKADNRRRHNCKGQGGR